MPSSGPVFSTGAMGRISITLRSLDRHHGPCQNPGVSQVSLYPVWTGGGGGQNGPAECFAKYLDKTLWLLRPLYRSSFKVKSLRIGHSLLLWQPINGGSARLKAWSNRQIFQFFFLMMLKLGRNIRWLEILWNLKKLMTSFLIRKYDVIIVVLMSWQIRKWKVFIVSLFSDRLS